MSNFALLYKDDPSGSKIATFSTDLAPNCSCSLKLAIYIFLL